MRARGAGRCGPWVPLLAGVLLACGSSPTAPHEPTPSEVEARSLELVNDARAAAGVPPMSLSEAVAAVARAHSVRMRDEGFFGHMGSDHLGLTARLQAAGIAFHGAAENLARTTGIADPAGFAHTELMASEEHREHILGPDYRLAGVGVARAGDTFWLTQIFIQP